MSADVSPVRPGAPVDFGERSIVFVKGEPGEDLADGYQGIRAMPGKSAYEDLALASTMAGIQLSPVDAELAATSMVRVLERPDRFALMQARTAALRMIRHHVEAARLQQQAADGSGQIPARVLRAEIRKEEHAIRSDARFVLAMLGARAKALNRPVVTRRINKKGVVDTAEDAESKMSDLAKYAVEQLRRVQAGE